MSKKWLLLTLLVLLFTIVPLAAQSEGAVVYSTAQRFDNGLMIWRSDTAHIWVLGNNGQVLNFPVSSYSCLPDNPIFGTPPSRLRPIFGFGKVWGNHANVRNLLGWPTLPEIGFNMRIRAANRTFYLTQLDGRTIQVNSNNTWMWASQTIPPSTARVVSFNANPDPVAPGRMMTLTWNVEGVEVVLLEVTGAEGNIYVGALQDLPLVGSTTMNIPFNITGDVRAVIWGANRIRSGSNTMYERVVQHTIAVSLDLSSTTTSTTYAAFQQYQNGFMIWRADTGGVYIFYGSAGGMAGGWPQRDYQGLPDNALAAPAGFVTPINGFGRVWGNNQVVRESLGWATGGEQGYQLTVRAIPGATLSFSLPDGRQVNFTYFGRFWDIS
jgi:hypothetical protein